MPSRDILLPFLLVPLSPAFGRMERERSKARLLALRKCELFAVGLILISFILGIYVYPQLPGKLASHWNAQGKADGYMSKFWGLFLLPIISCGLFLLFLLIPRIDPLKANIDKFRGYYDGFMAIIMLFFFYLYLLTILWNLGRRFNMIAFLTPAFGILFYYCGILIKHAKRNWFIGIRTPWTLSSETVWEKTHQIGEKLFKIAGVLALLGVLFQRYAFALVIIPIIIAALYTFIYSYFEYQKEMK
jgi:uncharacterized membrane protein